MFFELDVPVKTIKEETAYSVDIGEDGKQFPVLVIGTDSYIENGKSMCMISEDLLYNFQVGRYTSIAPHNLFIIDMNHNFNIPCQGRIVHDDTYEAVKPAKRKGEIIVMNDCWIGNASTIMNGVTLGNGAVVGAGSVVTRDVPPYAIVAGNPAKIIGYRFEPEQIEALETIRWWNWDHDKVVENIDLLYGDIDDFIAAHIDEAKREEETVEQLLIPEIEKTNTGEFKRWVYFLDFYEDYPNYPVIIREFAKKFQNTNHELLIYVEDDENIEKKLFVLNHIFEKYEDVNCYVNIFVGKGDVRDIFRQSDYYITNREKENVYRMDLAMRYGVKCVSAFKTPYFEM